MLDRARTAYRADGATPESFLQVAVGLPGRAIACRSWGTARPGIPASNDHLINTWCATKPVVALAALAAFEAHGLDPEGALCAPFADHPLLRHADYSLLAVLAHEAPGNQLDGLHAMLLPPGARRRACIEAISAAPAAGYSEFLGWLLLGEVLAECAGTAPEAAVEAWLDEIGLGRSIRFPTAADPADEDDLAFHRVPYAGAHWWMGHDRLPSVQCSDRIAAGGYSSAAGLARFAVLVREALAGAPPPGFPSSPLLATALNHRRTPRWEATLRRDVAMSGGFMLDLHRHGYDPVGRDLIGHSGLLGTSGMVLDRGSGLVAAFAWGDLDFDQDAMDARRRRVLEAIVGATRG